MIILIIDYGETSIKMISQILFDLNVQSIIQNPEQPYPDHLPIAGLVLSGGPDHVYDPASRKLPAWIFKVNVPILGICYGMELLVEAFGGKIGKMDRVEKGFTRIDIVRPDRLLGPLGSDVVWMNHLDAIARMPVGFTYTAISQRGIIAGITDDIRIWGIQFHPESKVEVLNGSEYFENFIDICESFGGGNFNMLNTRLI